MFVCALTVLLRITRQPEGFHFDSQYTFTLTVSLVCSTLGSTIFVSPPTLLALGGFGFIALGRLSWGQTRLYTLNPKQKFNAAVVWEFVLVNLQILSNKFFSRFVKFFVVINELI